METKMEQKNQLQEVPANTNFLMSPIGQEVERFKLKQEKDLKNY